LGIKRPAGDILLRHINIWSVPGLVALGAVTKLEICPEASTGTGDTYVNVDWVESGDDHLVSHRIFAVKCI